MNPTDNTTLKRSVRCPLSQPPKKITCSTKTNLHQLKPLTTTNTPVNKTSDQQKPLHVTSSLALLRDCAVTISFVLAANTIHEKVIENTPPELKHYAHLGFIGLSLMSALWLKNAAHHPQVDAIENQP